MTCWTSNSRNSTQLNSVKSFKSLVLPYFTPLTLMTDSLLFSMRTAEFTHLWRNVGFFSCSLLEGVCCSTFLFKILQRHPVEFKACSILGQVPVFTVFFFKNFLWFEKLDRYDARYSSFVCRLGLIWSTSVFNISTDINSAFIDRISPTPFLLNIIRLLSPSTETVLVRFSSNMLDLIYHLTIDSSPSIHQASLRVYFTCK